MDEFESIIINILKEDNLYDDNLDIFRIDETIAYNRYVELYETKKTTNDIRYFNNLFTTFGGRIYSKKNIIAKTLDIKNSYLQYNDKYLYVIPNYKHDYDYLNKFISYKLKKLKNNKNLLVIASPIRANALDKEKEINLIYKLYKDYEYTYNKIIIVNINKIEAYEIKTK